MSLEGLDERAINDLERQFRELVTQHGGAVGNVTLLRELGWPDDQYWSLRDRMIDAGELQLGRGRGGSVRLTSRNTAPVDVPRPPILPEGDLYEPMARVIRESWGKDQRFGRYIVENIARQGRRDTGGTWTRPDIVVASLTTLLYVPGKHFDVVTFEVKPWAGLDVTAVYEALAHARAATRSYVIVHVPVDQQDTGRMLDRVEAEAKRHGIGLITVAEPGNYETWEELVEAVYEEPAPQALNDFVSLQFSEGAKQEITQWFR